MKIAGMQLDMHWRLDDWPDEIHVAHALTPTVGKSYVQSDALDRACEFIADNMGDCPYSKLDAMPRDCAEECTGRIAGCWRLYFLGGQ